MFKKAFKFICKLSLFTILFIIFNVLALSYTNKLLTDRSLDWLITFPEKISTIISHLAASPHGEVIVAGYCWTDFHDDKTEYPWLIKLGPNGSRLWEKSFHQYNMRVDGLAVLPNGNVLFAGTRSSHPFLPQRVQVVTLDPKGDHVRTDYYGGSNNYLNPKKTHACCILPLPLGGFLLAGATRYDALPSQDAWLAKIGPRGNQIWDRTYGGPYFDEFHSIHLTRDGSLLVCGMSKSGKLNEEDLFLGKLIAKELWLLKLTAEGDVLWQKTIKAPPGCKFQKNLAIMPNGDLLFYGEREDEDETHGCFFATGWLTRTDSRADKVIWSKAFDIERYDETPRMVTALPSGNLLVSGQYLSDDYTYGAFVLCLTGKGELLWGKTFGGKRRTYFDGSAYIPEQSIVLAGSRTYYGSDYHSEIWVAKLTDIHTWWRNYFFPLAPRATFMDLNFKTGKLKQDEGNN